MNECRNANNKHHPSEFITSTLHLSSQSWNCNHCTAVYRDMLQQRMNLMSSPLKRLPLISLHTRCRMSDKRQLLEQQMIYDCQQGVPQPVPGRITSKLLQVDNPQQYLYLYSSGEVYLLNVHLCRHLDTFHNKPCSFISVCKLQYTQSVHSFLIENIFI